MCFDIAIFTLESSKIRSHQPKPRRTSRIGGYGSRQFHRELQYVGETADYPSSSNRISDLSPTVSPVFILVRIARWRAIDIPFAAVFGRWRRPCFQPADSGLEEGYGWVLSKPGADH